MKALFEGREAQRAGIAIGEVKKRMLDIIRGPEPVADENTQTKWQAACLDGHPKIEDVWTYAIPIPWRHGEGNKNDRQVVVPNQWNENKLPPFLHACRYLRPLLVNTEHITSEVLPESIRHTNKQRYASFLLQVKLHARFVTQSNLELFREIHQPRPQNFIPLVKGRPVYKTGADALLSPSGRYSNPVSQQVTDGSTGDDLNARKRKTVHDRMVEQYEDNFPKRTKPSRRMPSPGPDKPTHAQLATPPIYHRSGRSSHRPKVTTAQGDGGSEDSALAIRLRPTIDDFLREQEDSAWFSPSGMTPEELEDRIEATAIASHHQSELDMVYFAQHSTVRWRTGNTDYLPRADERVLYNPEEYEARRG
ncbi:hypothetical protein KVT40_007851 [Elsinoe batatas]|uniref:Uncharacterized protein n=1 Tax=Elsinoe batatas TaxID=2601811 RepID=A0A8K0KVP0_9PEZI|nr:hypothetical protein KVT40_007851 [Elsinoe batatas]